jgi:pyroglutamyl-peptidase
MITGFEPFRNESVNPSGEVCKMVQQESIEGCEVVTRILPVVFDEARERAIRYVEETLPDLIFHLGEAGGRTHISVERIAINCDDAGSPDNAGQEKNSVPIVNGGPDGLFSTVPVKKIVDALQKAHIPAVVSNSAGTYVCNHVFYGMLHHIQEKKAVSRVGFMHLPYLPQQTVDKNQKASMDLHLMVKAVSIAIQTCL